MDVLASLIMSLTKSEKRYFRMFTSLQGGEKTYLKLFEAVEKFGDYDEEKIRKKFEGEEFVKRLPAVKNYLYSLILKSLRVMHGGNTAESQLKEMIEDARFLFERRLYKQSAKILERAREIAKTNELFLLQIEINTLREKVMVEQLTPDKFGLVLQEALPEETRLLELLKNLAQYRNLYHRIALLNRRIKEARTDEELEAFNSIINDPLLQSVDRALSFDARNYFYHIHLIYNHAKGDNEACFLISEKQLALIESSVEKMEENPKMYISALNNVLLCQIHLHRYDNFNQVLAKLRTFPVKSLNMEVSRFVSSYTFEMVMYLDSGDFHRSIAIREEITDGLKKYHDKINSIEEITLLYNLFYSYFGTGEFSKALVIINKLLNEYHKELRYDVQSAVRILNLILHYELGNKMLLEYNTVSTYRFLSKSKRLYKLENIVLNFLRKKMPRINTKKEQLESFVELKKELEVLCGDPYEKKAFEYFDYISWLDSKIHDRPFAEIIKDKFAGQNAQNVSGHAAQS
jgi:hypothetical protein